MLFEIPIALLLATSALYEILRDRVGDGGLALLADDEVLVRVNYVTGDLDSDDRPGAHAFMPWFEQAVRLDRRPVRYVMGKSDTPADFVAPPLVVRARDGSSYSFERVEVQVVLDSETAHLAFVDHGATRESIVQLVHAYSRAVLRDAFGPYTPPEVMLPENKQAATDRALAGFERVLGRHGVRVIELSSSKPRFSAKYQETIHRRQVAEQDVERLVRERAQLLGSRDELLAIVREKKDRELANLRRTLADKLLAAQHAADRTRRQADIDAQERLAEATLQRDEHLSRAAVIEQRHRAEAQTLVARLARLEAQGELAVRAALVERLGSIQFELVPYDTPSEPEGGARRVGGKGGVR